MKRKLVKSIFLICALTFTGFFALPVADAVSQQTNRYFWVYNCPSGDYEFFEYKPSEKGERSARKLCGKHARHEKNIRTPIAQPALN